MNLLLDIVGVLLVGATVAALSRSGSSTPVTRAAGVALVVVTVAALFFFQDWWTLINDFGPSNRSNGRLSLLAAEDFGGIGAQPGFLEWAREKIAASKLPQTFYVEPRSARSNPLFYQWSSYQLLPARETELPQEANWLVFYGADPRNVWYSRREFGRIYAYGPGLEIAQRTNAY